MSFNSDDKKTPDISRSNYEEYFLLYADNELTADDRTQVEQFLLEHPDLQSELDTLLNTKLPAENIRLENKEALLADSMKVNAADESLLLYLDNELSVADKKKIEEKLLNDKTYQLQYDALFQTKLVAEKIVFLHKKELYRRTKKTTSLYWLRIAAAVIILIGMGIIAFNYQHKPDITVATTPQKTEERKDVTAPKNKNEVPIKKDHRESVTPDVPAIGKTDDAIGVLREIKKKPLAQKQVKKELIAPEKAVDDHMAQSKNQQQENISINREVKNTPQQSLNNNDVTPPIVASLHDQTTDPITAVQRDVVKIDNEKKASLKGLLRKATRFIERRTNISTTNENNELVIGAVALKL